MEGTQRIKIEKYELGERKNWEDIVILEYPFTIIVNGEEWITLLCSPKNLVYLALGFLLSEGLLRDSADIRNYQLDEEKGFFEIELIEKASLAKRLSGKRTLTTGCGKGTLFYHVMDSFHSKPVKSDLRMSAEVLIQLVRAFNKKSSLFIQTGGVHSACLSDGKEILLFHEDVGRHNALDKIVGEAFFKKIDLQHKLLITSGRISSEMLIKAAKRGIPILISRSAPTHLALELAEKLEITVIGFARGNRMNIYTGGHRVIHDLNA